jgi:acetyl esterase/lipase
MSQNTQQDHITKKTVVYSTAGTDAVTVRRDVTYQGADGSALAMDVYYPPKMPSETRLPAVLFVTGFPDPGAVRMLGCKMKDMGSYVSWARLVAASGMIAVTSETVNPAIDVTAAFQHVQQNAGEFGIDETRLGVWSCSGNVPNALSLLTSAHAHLKCAVLYYGYVPDVHGSTTLAETAKRFGFVNPSGISVDDMPPALPIFIARAGQDRMPGLNEALDGFIAAGLSRNLPLTVMNHPQGPHAFELFDDSAVSRHIVRLTLEFLGFHLRG